MLEKGKLRKSIDAQTVLSSENLESIFLKAPDLEQLFQTRKVIGKLNIQDVLKVLSQHFIPN